MKRKDPNHLPRGHRFGLLYLSHVYGNDVKVLEHETKWEVADHAHAKARALDPRLNPQVVLVDMRAGYRDLA